MRGSILITTMLLAGACTGLNDKQRPNATEGQQVSVAFAETLIEAGIPLTPVLTIDDGVLGVPDHVYDLPDRSEIRIFQFLSDAAAVEAADEVSPDGSMIGTKKILWSSSPRYYLKDQTILVQVGGDERLSEKLEQILGPPFASQ